MRLQKEKGLAPQKKNLKPKRESEILARISLTQITNRPGSSELVVQVAQASACGFWSLQGRTPTG